MKLPRLAVPFILNRVSSVRCIVRSGRSRWVLYLYRGPSVVLLRLSDPKRPWYCHRFSGSTASWNRGSYGEREDFIVAFLRKLTRPQPGALDRPDTADPKLASAYPALCEHLCRTRDDDGQPRQTCSLTLFGAQGGFRAFLNDRDTGAAIAVTADAFTGILAALEAELQSDHPNWHWRPEGNGKGAGKGRKSS